MGNTNEKNGQALMEVLTSVVPFGGGRVKVSQVPITEGAPAAGQKISDLNLPREVIIGCILRDDEICVPHGETRIIPGHILILISAAEQSDTAIKILTGR